MIHWYMIFWQQDERLTILFVNNEQIKWFLCSLVPKLLVSKHINCYTTCYTVTKLTTIYRLKPFPYMQWKNNRFYKIKLSWNFVCSIFSYNYAFYRNLKTHSNYKFTIIMFVLL